MLAEEVGAAREWSLPNHDFSWSVINLRIQFSFRNQPAVSGNTPPNYGAERLISRLAPVEDHQRDSFWPLQWHTNVVNNTANCAAQSVSLTYRYGILQPCLCGNTYARYSYKCVSVCVCVCVGHYHIPRWCTDAKTGRVYTSLWYIPVWGMFTLPRSAISHAYVITRC